MSFQLSITKNEVKKLTYTNRVYVHPSIFDALLQSSPPEYTISIPNHAPGLNVWVEHLVFIASPLDSIKKNEISLNLQQRASGSFKLEQLVTVKLYQLKPELALNSITVSLDIFGKKASTNKVTVDTSLLEPAFRSMFLTQIFYSGQKLALDFEGTLFNVAIEKLNHADITEGQKVSQYEYGQLLQSTKVIFKKAAGQNNLILVGNVDADERNETLFKKDFNFEQLGIGGLDEQFKNLFRRALTSRMFPGLVKQLGINHVRGILLYGPPGCGKTLIARQIGKMLNAREPKIINGPEVLDKFVGGSEEKVRALFKDAEDEQREMGDASMLHIIIFDEMDAIMKTRGSTRDSTGVTDSVVNQLLSKIDGVESLNNILIIGMTNRKDMIDEAILRPGRLEIQLEIPLPDEHGRLQILTIYVSKMNTNKRVSQEVVDRLPELAHKTKNFTPAELEGMIRNAASFALARNIDAASVKAVDSSSVKVQWSDVMRAFEESAPAFGNKDNNEIQAYFRNGICNYGSGFEELYTTLQRLVNQTRTSKRTPLMSVLLEGAMASGKTAIAAKVAAESDFPFVRLISPDSMIGYSESSKCSTLLKIFTDSYKSPLSIIIIDDIERIIEYTPVGHRFSNVVLQTLLILMRKIPPTSTRLLVIGTTAISYLLEDLQLTQSFNVTLHVSQLQSPDEIQSVINMYTSLPTEEASDIAKSITKPIGVKQLLMVMEMAKSAESFEQNENVDTSKQAEDGKLTLEGFMECLHTVGF